MMLLLGVRRTMVVAPHTSRVTCALDDAGSFSLDDILPP